MNLHKEYPFFIINNPIAMSTEEKRNPDKNKDSKKKTSKEESALDKELDKTFPASDPPSHTRPGSERDVDDKKT